MRYLAVGFLFLTVACGGGDGSDRAGTADNSTRAPRTEAAASPSPTAEEPDLTNEELAEVLLSVGDLPTGWTTSVPEEEDDEDYCGSDKDDIATPLAEATADFQQSETGPFLNEELSVYNGDGAELVAEAFRKLPQDCPGWTTTEEDGTQTEWKLTPLSFPKFGDETVANRISAEVPFFGVFEVDAVLIRRGDTINLVYYGVLGLEGIDSQQTEEFVRLANKKLRAVD